MQRAWLCIALLSLATAVQADRVDLKDGSSLFGQASQTSSHVTLKQEDGQSRQIPIEQVQAVTTDKQLQQQLQQSLRQVEPNDVSGLMELAGWARQNRLEKQGRQICQQILQIRPDHQQARQVLGFVRFDDQWLRRDAAVDLAGRMLSENSAQAVVDSLAPELVRTAESDAQRIEAMALLGRAQLIAGSFAQARNTFQRAAAMAQRRSLTRMANRYENIALILKQHPDGVYLLQEAYPADAVLIGGREYLRPGPISLTHPLGLDAAIRDAGGEHIRIGRELIEQAVSMESSDPERAKAKYYRAELTFDQADSLVDGLSRSYRVEIARRKISAIRQDIETAARRYDDLERQLGARELSQGGFQQKLERMIHHLASVEEGMDEILQLAQPYRQDLVLEIQWARSDLRTIRQKRKILQDELDS